LALAFFRHWELALPAATGVAVVAEESRTGAAAKSSLLAWRGRTSSEKTSLKRSATGWGRVEGEHIVDRVVREYTITYSMRGGDNAAVAYAFAEVDDAERLAALIKALMGKEPKVYRMKDGKIKIVCYREHLEGFRRFAELADAIEKWLEEMGR
jgi:hypothetical protein